MFSDGPPADFAPESLSEDWRLESGSERLRFEEELNREIGPGHELWQQEPVVVAVRKHNKEIIALLPATGSWARVHLTWAKESYPGWPMSVVTASRTGLLAELADAGIS